MTMQPIDIANHCPTSGVTGSPAALRSAAVAGDEPAAARRAADLVAVHASLTFFDVRLAFLVALGGSGLRIHVGATDIADAPADAAQVAADAPVAAETSVV